MVIYKYILLIKLLVNNIINITTVKLIPTELVVIRLVIFYLFIIVAIDLVTLFR